MTGAGRVRKDEAGRFLEETMTTTTHKRTKPALVIRLTADERELIHRAAALAGESTNTYCRTILLDVAADQLRAKHKAAAP